jgi:CheY-like chemotaxis protein
MAATTHHAAGMCAPMPDAREPHPREDASSPVHREVPSAAPTAPTRPLDAAIDTIAVARAEALGYLANGVAHDLANPLGAILAFAAWLESDQRLPDDLRDDARLFRIEADRTHRLVRTLLEFAGTRAPVVAPVDVADALADIVELEAFLLAEVDVRREVEPGLPDVIGDPSRVRQLLTLLSVAAIRGLGEHPPRGRVTIAGLATADGRVSVSFVSEAPRHRDAMPAVDTSAARDLAQELGADLVVDDLPSGGSFVVTFAVEGRGSTIGAPDPSDATPDAGDGERSAGEEAGATPVTVLVCDDEAAIRTLIARVLEQDGDVVVQAATVPDALDVLRRNRVDVVLTDHHMPGMSGMDLYAPAVAAHPALRDRFVLMTGEPGADDLVRFAGETGVRVLPKPFELATVVALVRDLGPRERA